MNERDVAQLLDLEKIETWAKTKPSRQTIGRRNNGLMCPLVTYLVECEVNYPTINSQGFVLFEGEKHQLYGVIPSNSKELKDIINLIDCNNNNSAYSRLNGKKIQARCFLRYIAIVKKAA